MDLGANGILHRESNMGSSGCITQNKMFVNSGFKHDYHYTTTIGSIVVSLSRAKPVNRNLTLIIHSTQVQLQY